jgi:hypothetical protein
VDEVERLLRLAFVALADAALEEHWALKVAAAILRAREATAEATGRDLEARELGAIAELCCVRQVAAFAGVVASRPVEAGVA